jgi:hypothetical protein
MRASLLFSPNGCDANSLRLFITVSSGYTASAKGEPECQTCG